MLKLEFGKSKPDGSHSEQSLTKKRKTASCLSETLKANAGDGPHAAGCPVSNLDGSIANALCQEAEKLYIQRSAYASGHDKYSTHFYDRSEAGKVYTISKTLWRYNVIKCQRSQVQYCYKKHSVRVKNRRLFTWLWQFIHNISVSPRMISFLSIQTEEPETKSLSVPRLKRCQLSARCLQRYLLRRRARNLQCKADGIHHLSEWCRNSPKEEKEWRAVGSWVCVLGSPPRERCFAKVGHRNWWHPMRISGTSSNESVKKANAGLLHSPSKAVWKYVCSKYGRNRVFQTQACAPVTRNYNNSQLKQTSSKSWPFLSFHGNLSIIIFFFVVEV